LEAPRVLVVDDEEGVRANVQWVMNRQGFVVDTAASEAEAQERLNAQRYDVIIADMKMDQDESGITVLQWAKSLDPDVEVIILTAYGNLQNAARAMEAGAYSYVEKNVPDVDVFQMLLLKVKQALERRKLKEENRQLHTRLIAYERQATLGVLASAIAHEVNNPLTSILGYTQFALEQIDDASPLRRDLTIIEEQTLRCQTILRHILEFARPDEGEAMPVNLCDAVERMLVLLQRELQRKRVNLERRYADCNALVIATPNQIAQVVMNLMINAMHAMPDGGSIAIETTGGNGTVILRISDTGKGIPPEYLPHIFDPFFTTKEPGKGTGLGLYICKDIITQLHGSIEVESEVGKGTTFTITLPTT